MISLDKMNINSVFKSLYDVILLIIGNNFIANTMTTTINNNIVTDMTQLSKCIFVYSDKWIQLNVTDNNKSNISPINYLFHIELFRFFTDICIVLQYILTNEIIIIERNMKDQLIRMYNMSLKSIPTTAIPNITIETEANSSLLPTHPPTPTISGRGGGRLAGRQSALALSSTMFRSKNTNINKPKQLPSTNITTPKSSTDKMSSSLTTANLISPTSNIPSSTYILNSNTPESNATYIQQQGDLINNIRHSITLIQEKILQFCLESIHDISNKQQQNQYGDVDIDVRGVYDHLLPSFDSFYTASTAVCTDRNKPWIVWLQKVLTLETSTATKVIKFYYIQ
jgi:hypothetical protein